jgi:hypothetical protein
LKARRNEKDGKEKTMSRERFESILEQMKEIHDRKNKDYAGEDYLSNLKMCEGMGIPAWKGVVIRMTDKMARLMNLAKSEDVAASESVIDTFLDMGIYSGMGLIAYEDFQNDGGQKGTDSRKSVKPPVRRRRKKTLTQTAEPQVEGASVQTV